ncbi:hypothetical protein [Halocalculus aciditolerans]|nr:hypothetical protein [Halocalculus aciditolerans]
MSDFGGSDFKFLTPSTTVQRDRVMLYVNTYERNPSNLTVHKVYWEEGSQTVVRNGTKVEVPAAVNVTETTEEVAVSGDSETLVPVHLTSHYDDEVEVTMWVEGDRSNARWRFAHQTSETMRPVNLETAGAATWWGLTTFLFPAVFGVVIGWPIGYLLQETMLVGPMKDRRWWMKIGAAGGFVAIFVLWDGLASLLISLGPVTGIITFALTLGVVLDNESSVRKVLLRQLMTGDGIQEQDDVRALRTTQVKGQLARVIEHDGDHYLVAKGARRAFARAIAGAAKIEDWDRIEDNIPTSGGSSYAEEIHLDPRVDEPLDIVLPQINIAFPATEDITPKYIGRVALGSIAAVGIGAMVSWTAWGTPSYGWLALAPVFGALVIRPNNPRVRFEPASTMQMQAETRNTLLARDYAEGETNDELRRRNQKLEGQAQAERVELENERRKTATDEVLRSRGADPEAVGESEREAWKSARDEDKEADDEEERSS